MEFERNTSNFGALLETGKQHFLERQGTSVLVAFNPKEKEKEDEMRREENNPIKDTQ